MVMLPSKMKTYLETALLTKETRSLSIVTKKINQSNLFSEKITIKKLSRIVTS
jgi:hypothetical protein